MFTVVVVTLLVFAGLVARADTSANRVLGQFDFVHNSPNILTNTGLWNPQSVAVDQSVNPNRLGEALKSTATAAGQYRPDAVAPLTPLWSKAVCPSASTASVLGG